MLLNSKIIWAALLLSQFIYVYVVHSMRPQALQTEPQMDHFLFVPLAMTAAVCLLLSYWVPNFLVKANVKKLPSQSRDLSYETIQRIFSPFILRLVLLEAVTIYGFVLSFMNDDSSILYFITPVILSYIVIFPSKEKWQQWIKKNQSSLP